MRNLEELKQQGRILLDEKRDEFVKQRLLSDEFFEMIQKNKKPMDLLMSYYQCASTHCLISMQAILRKSVI